METTATEIKTNVINWFEIPVSDMERARAFYSQVFGWDIHTEDMGGALMGFFPHENRNISGALVLHESYIPTEHGCRIYFDCGDDLQPILDRVEPHGGQVTMPKAQITPEIGYYAMFRDTEGNLLALHSAH